MTIGMGTAMVEKIADFKIEKVDNQKHEVKFSWNGDSEKWQIGLRNEKTLKWYYFEVDQTEAELSLEPGVYLSRIRMMFGEDVVEYGPWSDAQYLALLEEGEVYKGEKALLLHPTQGAFYHNVDIIRQEISEKTTVLKSLPIAVSVILEGRGCNFKCFYCTHNNKGRSFLLNKKNTFSKGFRFEKDQEIPVEYVVGKTVGTPKTLIDSFGKYAPFIKTIMFGGSEPTIYPEFRSLLVKLSKFPQTQMSVCTNAALLDEDLARLFVKANFPWIRISIDGATSETFRKIRKGNFDKVIGNIKRLIKIRGDRKNPKIQFNFVCCKSNCHEIPLIVDLAYSLKVEAVNYKMLIAPAQIESAWEDDPPFYRPLEKENPLNDISLCAEILTIMDETEKLAKKRGVFLKNEAIRPAIFAKFPELSDLKYRKSIEEKTKFEKEKRALEHRTGGAYEDPIPMAEYCLQAYGLKVTGGREANDIHWRKDNPAPGIATVSFVRDGGAPFAQIEIVEKRKSGRGVRYNSIRLNHMMCVDLLPGKYTARIRAFFPGLHETKQGEWGDWISFTVDIDLKVKDGRGKEVPYVARGHILLQIDLEEQQHKIKEQHSASDLPDDFNSEALEEVKLFSVSKANKHIDWNNVFCHLPFTNISFGHHRVHFCCYARDEFNHSYFKGDDLTLPDIWNHPMIVKARKYMFTGRAALVCKPSCPHLKTGGAKNPLLNI